MSFEDEEEEIIARGANFGFVPPSTNHFCDVKSLGENPFYYRPTSVRIYMSAQDGSKVLKGTQFFYKNIKTGEEFTPGKHGDVSGEDFEEIKLKNNEYFNKFSVSWGDTKVYQVIFETNKGRNFEIGEKKGTIMAFDPDGENTKIIGCYGNFTKTLNSLGVDYINLIAYYKKITLGYFELKKLVKNKEKWKNKQKDLKLDNDEKNLVRICELPDAVFNSILKYCIV